MNGKLATARDWIEYCRLPRERPNPALPRRIRPFCYVNERCPILQQLGNTRIIPV
jgi:hypothetical protein